jgi:hypothetical protein
MRYYSLHITDPKTGQMLIPTASGGFVRGPGPATFSSKARMPMTGQIVDDPGALDIDLDIPVTQLAKPQGAARIKIRGVGLPMLGQAQQLAGYNVQLSAGMSYGLPLANTTQAGVILKGSIFQAYGNWEGVNQTLDLLVLPGPAEAKGNIFDRPVSFFWPAGTTLADAIAAALAATLPEFKTRIEITTNLVLPNDEAGFYANPSQWAGYILGLTQPLGKQLLGFDYPGVKIAVTGDTIYVFDGPRQTLKPVALQFQDFIGQPTWISGTEIQFNTVLRADIGVGNTVKFPSETVVPYALTSPAAAVPGNMVPVNSRIAFRGTFTTTEVHHFGSFRDPDGLSWVTAVKAAYNAGSGPVPNLS